MHISQIRESKYLKKEDVGRGILVTIKELTQENVAMAGQPEELKACLWFDEEAKPMVLNSVNAQLIAKFLGSEETNDWIGHKIVLYEDPTITFAGKIVGGIRARAPRNQPIAPSQRQHPQQPQQRAASQPQPRPQQPSTQIPQDDPGEQSMGPEFEPF